MGDYRSSGTDTVVKIVLVFFISLLSFSIGTFVGKKFSDNQHKMLAMEPHKATTAETAEETKHESTAKQEGTHAATASAEDDNASEGQLAELEQEMAVTEDLSNVVEKEDSAQAVSHETHQTDKAIAKHEVKAPAKDEHANINKHADKELHKPEVAAVRETAVQPPQPQAQSLTKVLAREMASQKTGNFTIQIASYPSKEEADKKVEELKALKFESFATQANIKGQHWYRVNVGIYATIKEAQESKTLLAERAKVSTAIIQKLKK